MSQRDRIAQTLAAQQRMRDIATYNKIMATPHPAPTQEQLDADPVLRRMEESRTDTLNPMQRPQVYESYLQGDTMPEDPRLRAYRGMQ